ncbi:MAG: 50S ribosomal protein L15 [Anaerolineae bacterium]|nr:50S ribosomal protein L15 [Anaerolineae bacterium]
MKLHELRPAEGSNKRRKRVSRGIAAGQGKNAGKGVKGQKTRRQGEISPYFEGGQLPLVRRLPFKRGFVNIFKVHYAPVTLERLGGFAAGSAVDPDSLAEAGIIHSAGDAVVILGKGELDKPLTVRAHRFSASARAKILAAGGTVEEIGA